MVELRIALADCPFAQEFDDIIDVRSPAEYEADHVPGAISIPVLSDEERVEVGTLDRQVSPFEARKRGAALTSANISQALNSYFADKPKTYSALIYCWRGGKRSGSMALVLDQVGFNIQLLKGGYKAFRRIVMQDLEAWSPNLDLRLISGPTGAGKTKLLTELENQGGQVLDLEGLAHHRGSLLGQEPDGFKQPTQKGFETKVWNFLRTLDFSKPIYVEAESPKIGNVFVPPDLFGQMRDAKRLSLEAEHCDRVQFLMQDYSHLILNPEALLPLLQRLKYRHGLEAINRWCLMAKSGAFESLVGQLLEHHYDPAYAHSGQRGQDPEQSFNIQPQNFQSVRGVAQQLLALR